MLIEDMDNFKQMTKHTENKRFSRKNILILALFMLFFCMGGSLWGQIKYKWTGEANTTNWGDAQNWSYYDEATNSTKHEVPPENAYVIISAGATYYPEINGKVKIRDISIENGAENVSTGKLTINSGAELVVSFKDTDNTFYGNVDNNGILINNGTLNASTLKNSSQLTNNGTLQVNDSILNNSGTFINGTGATVITNVFTNTSTVENDGSLTANSTIKNTSGTITNGTNGSTSGKVEGPPPVKPTETTDILHITEDTKDISTDSRQYKQIFIEGTNAQTITLNPGINYPEIIINKTNKTSVTFTNTVNTKKFTDTSNGDIIFEKGGNINSDTTFSSAGKVTVNAPFSVTGKLIHENGNTELIGTATEAVRANSIKLGQASGSSQNITLSNSIIAASQTYNAPVTINGGAVLSSTHEITFNNTISGGTGSANPLSIIGDSNTTVTFKNNISNISKVSIYSNTGGAGAEGPVGEIKLPENVTTSDIQSYNGPITLSTNTTLSATGKTITFIGDITGGKNLTISDSATTDFQKDITGVANLDVKAGTEIKLPANVTTTGTQTYNGPVTLTQPTTLSAAGQNITFNGDIAAGGNNLTISDSATTEFKNNITDIAELNVKGTTEIILPAKVTTTGAQTYNGPISSTAATTTLQSTGNALITVNGSASTFNQDITFNTTDNVIFDTALFKAKTITHIDGPTELKTNIEAETINFANLSINNATGNTVTIKATTEYNNTGTLTIPADKTLIVEGNINNKCKLGAKGIIKGAIENKGTLEIHGDLTNEAGAFNGLFSKATITNDGILSVTGNFTDNGEYKSTNNNDLIELNGTENQIFTVNKDTIYNHIKVTNASRTTGSNVTFKNKLNVNYLKTKWPIIFNDGAEIIDKFTIPSKGNVYITIKSGEFKVADFENEGTFEFGGTLNVQNFTNIGTFNLSAATDIYVNGDFNDETGTFGNLTTTNTIKIHLIGLPNGKEIKTGTQTFTPGTTIYDNVIIDNETSVPVIFKEEFRTKEFSDNTKYTGPITFEGSGKIQTATTLNTSGNVTIGKTGSTFTIGTSPIFANFTHTAGNTKINGTFKAAAIEVGMIQNTIFGEHTTGATINGTIETSGNQTYKGPVTLAGDSTLKTTKDISFNDTVDGTSSLTIGDTVATKEPTNVTFSGQIGSKANLTTLDINATTAINLPDNVTTTGTQTYNGTVNLAKKTTLNADTGDIEFKETITGVYGLIINKADNVSFSKNISGLNILEITATNTNLPESLTTEGNQIYNSKISLATAGTSLESTGGNIEFNQDITSDKETPFAVKVKTNSTPNKKTITLPEKVTTAGNQTYTGTVNLHTNGSTLNTKGEILFNNEFGNEKSLTIGSSTPQPSTVTFKVDIAKVDTGADPKPALSTMNIKAGTINLPSKVITTGAQTYVPTTEIISAGTSFSSGNDNTSIQGTINTTGSINFRSPVMLTGDILIENKSSSSTTEVNLTFHNTLNSNPTSTFTTKNIDNLTFYGIIGGISKLGDIDVSSTKKSVTLPASITAGKIKLVPDNSIPTIEIKLPANETTKLTGSNIYLSDNIDASTSSLEIANSGTFYFYDSASADDIAGKGNLINFTQSGTGKVEIAGDINASGDISFNSPTTLTGNVELIGKTITHNSTITGDKLLNLRTSASVADEVSIKGKIDTISSLDIYSNKINLNANVTTTKAQNYHGPVTLAEAVATTTTTANPDEGNIEFHDTVGPNSSTLTLKTQADQNVIFDQKILLKTIKDTGNKGNIKILAGGSTTADTTIETTGQLLIKNDSSSEQTFYSQNLIHTTGDTVIKGTVQSVSITLNKLSVEGNITTDTNQIYKGPVTLTEATNLKINETETSHVTFENTSSLVLASKKLTINGHTLYEGGNITAGNIKSAGKNGSYDFIIQPTNSPSEISAAISAKNILIDTSNQSITLNKAKITATSDGSTQDGDIAIFGSKFNTTDQVSGTTGIYTYNYVSPLKPTLPITKTGTEKLNVTGDSSLNSKNLYINGTTVSGAKTLTLSFANNYNTIANYATAYYSDFSGATVTIPTGKLVTEACTLSNTASNKQDFSAGWDSEDFTIHQAYTIDDDVICVEFNRPVRFINDGDKNGIKTDAGTNKILYSGNKNYNNKFYSESSSIFTEISPTITKTGPDSFSKIYLTAPDTWNTDATGESAGYGTNKSGNHISGIIPYLEIPRNKAGADGFSYFITDIYGKRLVDYSGSKKYDKNHEITTSSGVKYTPSYDQCAPIILSVSTGQELHDIDPKKWEHYDSHNFIEFIYSEPVMIGTDPLLNPERDTDGSKYKNPPKNITPKADAGLISNNSKGFNIAGIASIETGHISTGTKDNNEDFSVNTFYRRNPSTFRIAIAGKTSGSATDETLTWDGFINEGTTLPEGIVTPFANEKSTVKDYNGNCVVQFHDITLSPEGPVKTPFTITVSNEYSAPKGGNSSDFTYGGWDIYPPMFAPLNIPEGNTIHWTDNPGNQFEILGYSSGGTKLEELEFHLFDNTINTTPNNANNLSNIWYSSMGWYDHNTQKTACADIFGGSRPFSKNEKSRTTGGIRFHTINQNAFHYKVGNNASGKFLSVKPKAESTFFLGYSTSKDFPHNPTGELYFKLELDDKTHTIDTVFSLSYTPTKDTGYVTDLAGNKLKTRNSMEPISSIDRTPPTFNMTLSPINHKEIYVIFSKKLQTNMERLTFKKKTPNGIEFVEINENSSLEAALPHCFRFIKIDSSGKVIESADVPKIDTTVQAECHDFRKKNGKMITTVKLTLDRNITYEDLKSCYLQLAPTPAKDGSLIETSYDSMTGIVNAEVTLVRDNIGNFMKMYSAHATSDFAINFVNPLYAHTPDIKNNGTSFDYGLYKDGSWAVHDWSRNQQNYGTVYANEKVEIVTSIDNGEKDKSKGLPQGIVMYITEKPDPESVSTQINGDLQEDYRIWLPKTNPDVIFPAMSFVNNSSYTALNGVFPTYTVTEGTNKIVKDDLTKSTFTIDKELAEKYGTNKQMTFMFALSDSKITDPGNFTPVTILSNLFVKSKNTYDLEKSERSRIPLYCLRLEDPSDITSIDMWSYKTHSITLQRGGVTIFNNVINATYGEDTMLKVNVPTDGELSVMVLTLDGNIIKYLHRGNIKTGEYNYFWDGTNNNNEKVARGLYFIRVVGAGLDENRKVIVTR